MIERHTFKKLINTIVDVEKGITALETTLNCHFDDNWLVNIPSNIIEAIAKGFFEYSKDLESAAGSQIETIEELLYHFIYMEDCGNNSEHCMSKLVIVDEGKESQHSLPCTNIDELYNAIIIYITSTTVDFSFNYCHSYKEEGGDT